MAERDRTGAPPSPEPGRAKKKFNFKQFFTCVGKETMKDNVPDVGAMMAYYAILALFPMLVFIVTLALLVLPVDVLRDGVAMATSAMPPAARETVAMQTGKMFENASAGFAIGSAVVALWGASRGAVGLSTALNQIFNKQETRSFVKRQAIAIGVTFGVAVLVIMAMSLLVVGPVAGHWIADRFGLGGVFDVAWGIGRWIGAALLVMVVLAILYKFLPNTDAPFRIFTPGAGVGVVVWVIISLLFSVYLGHFDSYEATYGALGGGIIFLTWLWLSNIAILLGAEINDVIADMKKDEDPAAAQLADKKEPLRANPEAAAEAHVARQQGART